MMAFVNNKGTDKPAHPHADLNTQADPCSCVGRFLPIRGRPKKQIRGPRENSGDVEPNKIVGNVGLSF